MRSASLLVLLGLLPACGDDPPPPSILAYTEADTGRIVVYELGAGERASVAPTGAAGDLAVAPGGREVAYGVRLSDTDHAVFVADTDSGAAREVEPGAGGTLPEIRWARPDWFIYRAVDATTATAMVVAPGASTARPLSPRALDYGREVASPTEPSFVYSECSSGDGLSCPRQLVVEQVDGSARRVITNADRFAPVVYTADGARIIVHERRGNEFRLVARDLVGDGMVDLGPSDPSLEDRYPVPGLSRLSPDGAEVLTLRAGALLAVRVDGTGERTVAMAEPIRAGFTDAGDVVYEVARGDIFDVTMDVHVADGAATVTLGTDVDECFPVVVAPGGKRLAWSCATGTTVYGLPGGEVLWTDPSLVTVEPLGFGAADRGLVTAQQTAATGGQPFRYTLRYTTDDGVHVELGQAWAGTTPMGVVTLPPYSLAP